jgi:hypothetical protein
MGTTSWLLIGGLALVAIIIASVVLNRSWGSFPSRAGMLPPAGSAAPGMSRQPDAAAPAAWGDQQLGTPDHPVAALEPPGVHGGLVPITHALVRRSAEQALERGGSVTRYIVRQGEQVYFDFSQIADPTQRQEAYDLMQRFNAGQDVDIAAMLKMINRLFKP